jgi:hypothetical protein
MAQFCSGDWSKATCVLDPFLLHLSTGESVFVTPLRYNCYGCSCPVFDDVGKSSSRTTSMYVFIGDDCLGKAIW